MRIITGEYKGRRIDSVKGVDIRYTSDRVKESLFSIIASFIPDSRFADFCSGSGNIGIEAISRGAESVTFVDINPICIRTLSENLKKCGVNESRFRIMKMSASVAIGYLQRHDAQFDIIFLDPPYNIGLAERLIIEISKSNIFADNGLIIAEHDIKEAVPLKSEPLEMTRQERYGTTLLSFYKAVSNFFRE
ncbi:TPA: 16S rRNA (guanine(966)-N(2))-methyltransferase RsmD [bacterium]|nr:16S rRNA (guanine(966)-N(2))-methyltransferase RsmD [bacterium]